MADDLRARLVAALDECRVLTPDAQADAVLAVVQPKLDRLGKRIEDYRESRRRWMEAADADRRCSNEAARERDRFRLAWQSAQRRARDRRLKGERLPGGALRQALIDAGIITREDRGADAVEKIRVLGPQPACRHGVLPSQGLCLYCASEKNHPISKESLS